ncbi:MAG: hypothetical protein QM642_05505 [Edaphocola sp.]
MLFQRTYQVNTALSVSDIKRKLVGRHLQVHELDFEVTEKEDMLKIIPHAEEEGGLKTLPITHVEMVGNGVHATKIKMVSKPRKIDIGGPYIIVIFCLFCILGASGFYVFNPKESFWPPLTMIGVGMLVFIIFWFRMETGYFDYTRKIRDFVKQHVN